MQARAAAELEQQEARSKSLEAANRASMQQAQAAAAAAPGDTYAGNGGGASGIAAAVDGGSAPGRAPLPPLRRPWNSSASLGAVSAGEGEAIPPQSTRSEDGERRYCLTRRSLPACARLLSTTIRV